MIPVLPIVGAALLGYTMWRALARRKRRTGPDAGWRNPNYLAMEETGSWDPDTTMSTSSESPPFRNTMGMGEIGPV